MHNSGNNIGSGNGNSNGGKEQQRNVVGEKREVVEIAGSRSRNGRSREEGVGSGAPCGACKFLRRKCVNGCIFAPYFGSDQGAARFAAVHKVFGASNVSKLLLHIPQHRRQEAVVTISYEAQARLSDPVYGCVSTIFALQQQVAALQTELSMVQTQLINSRIAAATAFHHQQQQMGILQQASVYANNNSCNNNNMSAGNGMSSLSIGPDNNNNNNYIGRPPKELDEADDDQAPNFHGIQYELESPTIENISTSRTTFQALQIPSSSSQQHHTDDPVELQAFAHSLLHRK
eukprot:Gb_14010 [translate_table: standard]